MRSKPVDTPFTSNLTAACFCDRNNHELDPAPLRNRPPFFDKLDVQGRIRDAVAPMDMREFHDMINEVAAQHLGAIQVLGYVLGAVVGALTLL